MKHLLHNAALQLFERIRDMADQPHDSWRAIHIRLAGNKNYSAALRTYFFLKPVSQMLADYDGYLYDFEDGDIVVLFKGALWPVIEQMNAQFADFDAEAQNQESLFAVYDLSLHWQSFRMLCEMKARQAMHALNYANRKGVPQYQNFKYAPELLQ